MMHSLEVVSNNKHTIINMANPKNQGFAVTSITGITAPIGTINMTERATIDGSTFNGARANNRNIVITLTFIQGSYSIEELRHKCYQIFPVKQKIKLIFKTSTRTVTIDGYVETNDTNVFSINEGAQISIICESAYFSSYNKNNDGYELVVFNGSVPLFEFPFENNSLTEPLIEISELRRETSKNIIFNSEISNGFIVKLKLTGVASGIAIANLTTNDALMIDSTVVTALTGSDFISDDLIEINTQLGQKSITLYRGVNKYNLLPAITSNSKWLELVQGDNEIYIYAASGVENILTQLMYKRLYMGV